MWNDNDTHIDLIDFQHLVNSIENIINNENLLPCTIGLYGDWGSGKSSLMRMVEKKFEGEKDVITVKFNGWLFEGYDDAKTVLMGAILDELIEKRTLEEKGKALAKKLLKKIDWMKVTASGVKAGLGFLALGPAGLLAGTADLFNDGNIARSLSEIDYDGYLKKEESDKSDKSLRMGIREFHNDFSELLKETKVKKLIVFIDDLDRCNPETVIDTLEAIKLFLFVDNSSFVISADERLIKYAVRRRFPEIPGEGLEVGRDYLEKLIQFPIRIPQLSNVELETYINLLFTKIHIKEAQKFEDIRQKALEHKTADLFTSKYNIHTVTEIVQNDNIENLKEDLSLSAQITPILTVGLNGNPRQSKRFLNTLLIRLGMARSKNIELSKKVLAKLMLLEYFKPETFRRLSDLQAQQEGKPKEIPIAEEKLVEADEGKETKTKSKAKNSNAEIESWLSDKWISEWLKSEPALSEEDLRPYFYFSRDILATTSGALQRMSPQAQELYKKLISESETSRKKGLEQLEQLSLVDSASIFSTFCDKIRQQESLSGDNHFLQTLLEFCSKRSEHLGELHKFLKSLPVKLVPVSIVPIVKEVLSADGFEQLKLELFQYWASNTDNKQLAGISKKFLN